LLSQWLMWSLGHCRRPNQIAAPAAKNSGPCQGPEQYRYYTLQPLRKIGQPARSPAAAADPTFSERSSECPASCTGPEIRQPEDARLLGERIAPVGRRPRSPPPSPRRPRKDGQVSIIKTIAHRPKQA